MGYTPSYSGVTFTTAELLSEVRDMAAVPSSSQWTDAKLLAIADQCIAAILSDPVVRNSGMSGHWLDYHDELVSNGYRSGAEYLVPNRAASGTISHVEYYSSSTARPRQLEATTALQSDEVDSATGTGEPTHYYFRDGRLVVVPYPQEPESTAKMRIWYPRSHPKLVLATSVGFVDSASTGSSLITLTATHPAAWKAPPYAIDVYSAYSPHAPLLTRLDISSDAGANLSYVTPTDTGILSDLDVLESSAETTDYKAALSNTSDCIQLPQSMRAALIYRVVHRLLMAQGDTTEANQFWGMAQEELGTSRGQIVQRSKRAPVYTNHHSPLRAGSRRFRGWVR